MRGGWKQRRSRRSNSRTRLSCGSGAACSRAPHTRLPHTHSPYRVDDPNRVGIDLEFASQAEAAGLLAGMRKIWTQVEGRVMMNPRAEIAEVVETHQY